MYGRWTTKRINLGSFHRLRLFILHNPQQINDIFREWRQPVSGGNESEWGLKSRVGKQKQRAGGEEVKVGTEEDRYLNRGCCVPVFLPDTVRDTFLIDPAVILIVVGVVMFFITFCGCIGALRENIRLLKTVIDKTDTLLTLAPCFASDTVAQFRFHPKPSLLCLMWQSVMILVWVRSGFNIHVSSDSSSPSAWHWSSSPSWP